MTDSNINNLLNNEEEEDKKETPETDALFKSFDEQPLSSLSKNINAKSIYEKNLENKNSEIEIFKNTNISKRIESAFSDAVLIDVSEDE